MKKTLRVSFFSLLSVSSVLAFALGPVGAIARSGQDSTSTRAASTSKIEIDSWTRPESGWLYVLDPKPNAGASGGRVWLIEPEAGKVMGSIRTGDNPDFAVSPDGSRLYVASIIEGDSSELAVIDTAQGVVIQRAKLEDREVAAVLPSFSAMAVSGDGLVLRILLDMPKSDDADSFLLAAFDTQSNDFLRRTVHLGNCGPGRFISYPTAEHFDFLCPRTNRIRLIRVDAEARELQNTDITLPWERRIGAAEAIEPAAGQDIAIIRGDGAVVQMSIATQEFSDTAARPVLPNRVPPTAWPVSPDGSRIYLGYNGIYDRHYDNRFYLDYGRPPNLRPNDATVGEFRVLDTRTWKRVGTIKTKMPVWSAVITNDGNTLYAMSPQKHSILVIDTVKMRPARALKVGGAPSLALVAP